MGVTAVLLVPSTKLCVLFPNGELQGSLCSSDTEVIGSSIIQVSGSPTATGTSAIIWWNLELQDFKEMLLTGKSHLFGDYSRNEIRAVLSDLTQGT